MLTKTATKGTIGKLHTDKRGQPFVKAGEAELRTDWNMLFCEMKDGKKTGRTIRIEAKKVNSRLSWHFVCLSPNSPREDIDCKPSRSYFPELDYLRIAG